MRSTLTKAEKQKWFNKAYRGLKRQVFKKAADKYGGCFYLMPRSGLRCAIGQCIPSTGPGAKIRNLAGGVYGCGADLESTGVPARRSQGFWSDLQVAHDNACGPENMRDRLKEFAKARGLTVPRS